MLIGRKGRFVLKSPFSKYGDSLNGEIVAVAYIKHLASTGMDVSTKVYKPVGAEVNYAPDLAANVIVVTIKVNGGRKYMVPDKYIENLMDDRYNYNNAYITVKIGELPADFDYASVAQQISKNISDYSGVEVGMKDIFISVADNGGTVYSPEEAANETAKRLAKVANRTSDWAKLLNSEEKVSDLTSKVSSLENKLKSVSKVV